MGPEREFAAWMLDERGWSRQTRYGRLATVKRADRFVRERFGRPLLKAQPEHLVAFLAETHTPWTRNKYLADLRAFFRFACQTGRRRTNPASGIEPLREPDRLPRPVSPAQAERIVLAARRISDRCYAMAALIFYAGLRRGEVISLAWPDVDLDARRARVVGKGGHERVVPLNRNLVRVLRDWQRFGETDGFYLFPSRVRARDHISPQILRTELARAARLARVVAFTPHRGRHTFATELLERGSDIRRVQVLLGHKSLGSTQLYTKVAVSSLERDVARLDFENGDRPGHDRPRRRAGDPDGGRRRR